MNLPQFNSVDIPNRRYLLRHANAKAGEMVIVASTVTDAGAVGAGLPRSTILRQGMVFGQKAADSKFYQADDLTNIGSSICTPASVTSLIAIGAGAATKTFKFRVCGGPEITLTTTGAETSCAALITFLSAQPAFAGSLVATNDGSNKLVITSLRAGVGEYFEITTGTLNGQGGTGQDTFANNTKAGGSDGEYRVLGLGGGGYEDVLDMLGPTAAAQDKGAPNLKAAEFISSQLLNLTPEAKAVLARRGSIFG